MKQMNIFYADDDEDDLMFFREAIETIAGNSQDKINLHIHKNGEKLIENIQKNKDAIGVAFLDINMPLKNGFELLEEIRKDAAIKQFPVIMYSTSSNRDNIEKSKSLGANLYAVKPIDFHHLIDMLSTFLQMNWKNHQPDINVFVYK